MGGLSAAVAKQRESSKKRKERKKRVETYAIWKV